MIRQYPAILHSAENNTFWIELPDFPEAMTHGQIGVDDPEQEARELLTTAIQFRLHDGETVPDPSEITPSEITVVQESAAETTLCFAVALDPDSIGRPEAVVVLSALDIPDANGPDANGACAGEGHGDRRLIETGSPLRGDAAGMNKPRTRTTPFETMTGFGSVAG